MFCRLRGLGVPPKLGAAPVIQTQGKPSQRGAISQETVAS